MEHRTESVFLGGKAVAMQGLVFNDVIDVRRGEYSVVARTLHRLELFASLTHEHKSIS